MLHYFLVHWCLNGMKHSINFDNHDNNFKISVSDGYKVAEGRIKVTVEGQNTKLFNRRKSTLGGSASTTLVANIEDVYIYFTEDGNILIKQEKLGV